LGAEDEIKPDENSEDDKSPLEMWNDLGTGLQIGLIVGSIVNRRINNWYSVNY
jgi:hypothetical protein